MITLPTRTSATILAACLWVVGALGASTRAAAVDGFVLPGQPAPELTDADVRVEIEGRSARVLGIETTCATADETPGFDTLIYFDQHHLTREGRERSLELARGLVARLTAAGRVAIVSNGRRLRTVVDWTSDRARLLRGLAELAADADHQSRIAANPEVAIWFAERDLARLAWALGLLARAEQPAAALVFVDVYPPALAGEQALQAAVEVGGRFGGRVFVVERHGGAGRLADVAHRSGGTSLDASLEAQALGRQLRDEFTCRCRIRFEPGPRTATGGWLPLRVAVSRPGLTLRAPRRLWLGEDPEDLAASLLSRWGDIPLRGREAPVETHVIPTGFQDGTYLALVQIVIPAEAGSSGSWDLVASRVSANLGRQDFSSHLRGAEGVPHVYEAVVAFSPGAYELIAVARNHTTGVLTTGWTTGEWPSTRSTSPRVGPIAVLQEAAGLFVREGRSRTAGSLARPRYLPIRNDLRAALVGIVCRAGIEATELRVERRLLATNLSASSPCRSAWPRIPVRSGRISSPRAPWRRACFGMRCGSCTETPRSRADSGSSPRRALDLDCPPIADEADRGETG